MKPAFSALFAVAALAACSTTSTTSDPGAAPPGDDQSGGDDASPPPPPPADAGKKDSGGDGGGDAAVVIPVGTSTQIVAAVLDYAVDETSLYYSYGGVMRAGLDGSAPAVVPGLTLDGALALDDTRIFVATSAHLLSTPKAGGGVATVSSSVPASTYAISAAAGNVYFSWGEDDPPHGISSVPSTATNAAPQSVGTLNPRSVRVQAAGGRVFALDYGDPVTIGNTRNGGLWAFDTGGASTKITSASYGAIFSLGSLATYGTTVYVRGGAGLLRFDASASAGATPTTIIPTSACDIDGYDASSTVAADASGIYLACLVKGGDYEIRKYSDSGVLQKILGTSPNDGYGFVTHLTLTSTHAYWMGRGSSWAIYRAPK